MCKEYCEYCELTVVKEQLNMLEKSIEASYQQYKLLQEHQQEDIEMLRARLNKLLYK